MLNYIKTFRRDEDGAVTVDWVVLTAAIVGIGIAIMTTVSTNTKELGGEIDSAIEGETVDTTMPAG